jgi:hypothetical protein
VPQRAWYQAIAVVGATPLPLALVRVVGSGGARAETLAHSSGEGAMPVPIAKSTGMGSSMGSPCGRGALL